VVVAVDVANMKNSPSLRVVDEFVPENEMVDPPNGEFVAESVPEMKVDEAYIRSCSATSMTSTTSDCSTTTRQPL